jgi:hypothetical protein
MVVLFLVFRLAKGEELDDEFAKWQRRGINYTVLIYE